MPPSGSRAGAASDTCATVDARTRPVIAIARILIVGCGCRGGALARSLIEAGHPVRGTTRDQRRLAEIEALGAEAVLADPDRLATMQPAIEGASVACWLMGTALGEPDKVAALHGDRLASMLELIVDTPVRGFVYEAGGSLEQSLFRAGAAIARQAAETYAMPVEIVATSAANPSAWLESMNQAVARALS